MAVADIPTWNTYGPESPGLTEVCHFFDLAADASGKTMALLRSADGSQGVSIQIQQTAVALFHDLEDRQAAVDGYEPDWSQPPTIRTRNRSRRKKAA